jgi:ribosomal protein S18 acetylase RimI-like enzyme
MIVVAERVDLELVEDVARLIRQLSSSASPAVPSLDDLRRVVESQSTRLLLSKAPDGRVVGMLSLIVFAIPTGIRAFIEDVVVDRELRGQGLGEALTKRAMELALAEGARTIELTSRPERVAANRLYLKLGFEQRATNAFRYTRR